MSDYIGGALEVAGKVVETSVDLAKKATVGVIASIATAAGILSDPSNRSSGSSDSSSSSSNSDSGRHISF